MRTRSQTAKRKQARRRYHSRPGKSHYIPCTPTFCKTSKQRYNKQEKQRNRQQNENMRRGKEAAKLRREQTSTRTAEQVQKRRRRK